MGYNFVFLYTLSISFLPQFKNICTAFTDTAVAQAQAQHPDGTSKGISYSLFSGNKRQAFSINSITGEIYNKSVFLSNRLYVAN